MAFVTEDGAEIRLDDDERQKIGKEFTTWVDSVEDERRRLAHETWIKALDNYEGKEPIKQFPWAGASNVVLPITQTHSDALAARLFNASTTHDPVFTILSKGQGFVGTAEEFQVEVEVYAQWWQNISTWVQKEQLNFDDLMEELILTFVIYGDAFVYLPWEVEEVMDKFLDSDGEIVSEKRKLWDKPVPKVIHPKDVYINFWEKSVQTARRVGIRWDLDLPMINQMNVQGIYTDKVANELKELLEGQEKDQQLKLDGITAGNYYKEYGGNYYSPDEFERAVKKRVGIAEDAAPNALKMIKVFSRADLDGDGIPEEVVFDVERETGIVAHGRYANLLHKERPLVQYIYNKRPGSIYNRGVPELLFNIQKILNTTMRDILDNNKVQNTKMFLARKGGPIEENAKVYPSRMFFVDNIETDFKAVDLGTGRPVTSVQDIALIQQWGERLTGITDFNLGQEKRSRTPVGTTLALLEEGNKRIDRTITVMRGSMDKMWKQILGLYYQNGDPFTLAEIAAVNEGDREKFVANFAEIPIEEFQKYITINPEVSSNTLNRNVQRQEALALFAQVDAFYQRITGLANAIGGSLQDPVMGQLFLLMGKGFHRIMRRVLDTFDVKDQEALNPEIFNKLLEGVTSVEVKGNTEGSDGSSSPAEEAQGLVESQGDSASAGASLGKPQAGGSRVPGADISLQ